MSQLAHMFRAVQVCVCVFAHGQKLSSQAGPPRRLLLEVFHSFSIQPWIIIAPEWRKSDTHWGKQRKRDANAETYAPPPPLNPFSAPPPKDEWIRPTPSCDPRPETALHRPRPMARASWFTHPARTEWSRPVSAEGGERFPSRRGSGAEVTASGGALGDRER